MVVHDDRLSISYPSAINISLLEVSHIEVHRCKPDLYYHLEGEESLYAINVYVWRLDNTFKHWQRIVIKATVLGLRWMNDFLPRVFGIFSGRHQRVRQVHRPRQKERSIRPKRLETG